MSGLNQEKEERKMNEHCDMGYGESDYGYEECEFCGKIITDSNDLFETLYGQTTCEYCFEALENY